MGQDGIKNRAHYKNFMNKGVEVNGNTGYMSNKPNERPDFK